MDRASRSPQPWRPTLSRANLTAGIVVLAGLLLASGLVGSLGSLEGRIGLLAIAAFLAGLLSFLSPCTLPILPAYFAFTFQARRRDVVVTTVAFFLGLATTLTVLGAGASALSLALARHLTMLTTFGGLLVMAFGVLSLFGLGFSGLPLRERPAATALGSYVYGATFALGWTVCVGPILGAILTLLATQGLAVFQGAFLAFVYALGLGTPLILASVWFSRIGPGSRLWEWVRGRGVELRLGQQTIILHTTSVLSGLLLIAVGFLLASGQLAAITRVGAVSDVSLWIIRLEEALQHWLGLR